MVSVGETAGVIESLGRSARLIYVGGGVGACCVVDHVVLPCYDGDLSAIKRGIRRAIARENLTRVVP